MPCTVKCRCGKSTQKFNFLNPGDIESWECSRCPKEEPKKDAKVPQAPEEKPENSPMERKKGGKKKDAQEAE